MKSGAHFEQAADPAMDFGEARGRARDARKNLQQRGFAGAVAPDQSDDFALSNVEARHRAAPKDNLSERRWSLRRKGAVTARVSTSRNASSARARRRDSACQPFDVNDGFAHCPVPQPLQTTSATVVSIF